MNTKKRRLRKYKARRYATRSEGSKPRRIVILLSLAILTFFVYVFLMGNKSAFKLYSLHQQKKELIAEKERLKNENQQLEEEIKKLQTDKRYIEEVARKKYNFKKQNEKVIIVKAQ